MERGNWRDLEVILVVNEELRKWNQRKSTFALKLNKSLLPLLETEPDSDPRGILGCLNSGCSITAAGLAMCM